MTVDPRTLAADLERFAPLIFWPADVIAATGGGSVPVVLRQSAEVLRSVVVPLHDAWLRANQPRPFNEWAAGLVGHINELNRMLGFRADRIDKLEAEIRQIGVAS